MKKTLLILALFFTLTACAHHATQPQTLITIADAREHPAQFIDIGEPGDSVGDILTFDQPLLDENMKVIGTNSGNCIRTRVAHSFQCQWTLLTENGSITVSGRELDKGTSRLSIVGGTGDYKNISGEMASTNNNDGTFTQKIEYKHIFK